MTAPPASQRGLTLIEAVVSLVIVGALGAAALRAFSATTLTRALAQDRARGVALASDLMGEITAMPYGEPPDPAQSADLTDRSSFTTVGDYQGWSASPPITRSGAIVAPALWRREVAVQQVDLDSMATAAAATGALHITVRVYKGPRLVATEHALRTYAWDSVSGGGP